MKTSNRPWLILSLAIIALATLVPIGRLPPRFYWRFEWSDVVVNLMLYLPLGVVLARLGNRQARVVGLAMSLSTAIELLQGLIITGRRGSPADVITNTAGALLGAVLFLGWQSLSERPTAWKRGAALLLGLAPVTAWLLSGSLLSPAPPTTPQWYGLWAHHFVETEPFAGRITGVSFLGRPIPDDKLDSTRTLLAAARQGGLSFDIELVSAGPTAGMAQLASVADGRGNFVIGVNQLGADLLLYWWSGGAELGFRSPEFQLAGGARGAPGDTLAVHALVTRRQARLTVTTGGEQRTATWELTPLAGWRSLIPSWEFALGVQRCFDLVWVAGLGGYLLLTALLFLRRRPT